MDGARKAIEQAVLSWDGVTADGHRFGGVEFRFGKERSSSDTFTATISPTCRFRPKSETSLCNRGVPDRTTPFRPRDG